MFVKAPLTWKRPSFVSGTPVVWGFSIIIIIAAFAMLWFSYEDGMQRSLQSQKQQDGTGKKSASSSVNRSNRLIQLMEIGLPQYDLARVFDGTSAVPRVEVSSLPKELAEVNNVKWRKNAFIRSMLPLILSVNEEISRRRARLQAIAMRMEGTQNISSSDKKWLYGLAVDYGVIDSARKNADNFSPVSALAPLLERVDIVPTSLALAQSAIESGWGTSRFAREGNALFGQWVYSGDHLVPEGRDVKGAHQIRSFPTVNQSVRAYVDNLNTHWAYKEFRARRAALREAGGALRGVDLIPTLKRYSETGEEYLKKISIVIRTNNFDALDGVHLVQGTGMET